MSSCGADAEPTHRGTLLFPYVQRRGEGGAGICATRTSAQSDPAPAVGPAWKKGGRLPTCGRPAARTGPCRPDLDWNRAIWSGLREASAVLRDQGNAPKEGAWWHHGIEARPDRASKASKPLPEHGLVVMHSSATKPAHVPLCAQHFGHLDGICRSWRADALVPRVSWMIRVLSALRAS